MPATFSYASILHAVGQVLDQIGVKNFAIKEEEEGLFIEGYDGEGQLLVQGLYDIASLYDLMSRSEEKTEAEELRPGLQARFINSWLITIVN